MDLFGVLRVDSLGEIWLIATTNANKMSGFYGVRSTNYFFVLTTKSSWKIFLGFLYTHLKSFDPWVCLYLSLVSLWTSYLWFEFSFCWLVWLLNLPLTTVWTFSSSEILMTWELSITNVSKGKKSFLKTSFRGFVFSDEKSVPWGKYYEHSEPWMLFLTKTDQYCCKSCVLTYSAKFYWCYFI